MNVRKLNPRIPSFIMHSTLLPVFPKTGQFLKVSLCLGYFLFILHK